jgi:hypothetical protein
VVENQLNAHHRALLTQNHCLDDSSTVLKHDLTSFDTVFARNGDKLRDMQILPRPMPVKECCWHKRDVNCVKNSSDGVLIASAGKHLCVYGCLTEADIG